MDVDEIIQLARERPFNAYQYREMLRENPGMRTTGRLPSPILYPLNYVPPLFEMGPFVTSPPLGELQAAYNERNQRVRELKAQIEQLRQAPVPRVAELEAKIRDLQREAAWVPFLQAHIRRRRARNAKRKVRKTKLKRKLKKCQSRAATCGKKLSKCQSRVKKARKFYRSHLKKTAKGKRLKKILY